MTLQEFYARVGGDYNATLSRLPSEALVKKFILKYPGDPSFAQLKDALAAQDWELAFRASHTLKGVAQNLGMDRLYKAAAALCDAVRGPKPLEDESLWPPVLAAHAAQDRRARRALRLFQRADLQCSHNADRQGRQPQHRGGQL